MNYYNEFDPDAAQWIRNLIEAGEIPAGDVDERSIEDVRPTDLWGYAQCHFFAGIAGWPLALRLAGVEPGERLWTGSCPCQPFSQAGAGAGFDDQRHLWPAWFHLISQCRPPVVIGEQVASPAALRWFDLVSADLENAGYAVGGADLCSAGINGAHMRQRLYWVAESGNRGASRLGFADSAGPQQGIATTEATGHRSAVVAAGDADRLGNTSSEGLPQRVSDTGIQRSALEPQPWQTTIGGEPAVWHQCTDGKLRPISPEPGAFPMAYGLSRDMVRGQPELGRLARRAGSNRRTRLKGYGNAIDPRVAAEFVKVAL